MVYVVSEVSPSVCSSQIDMKTSNSSQQSECNPVGALQVNKIFVYFFFNQLSIMQIVLIQLDSMNYNILKKQIASVTQE